MLSVIIFYKLSYSTLLLTKQSIHQRCTEFGPLVLEFNPFNFLHLQKIGTKLSHDVLNPAHVPL